MWCEPVFRMFCMWSFPSPASPIVMRLKGSLQATHSTTLQYFPHTLHTIKTCELSRHFLLLIIKNSVRGAISIYNMTLIDCSISWGMSLVGLTTKTDETHFLALECTGKSIVNVMPPNIKKHVITIKCQSKKKSLELPCSEWVIDYVTP